MTQRANVLVGCIALLFSVPACGLDTQPTTLSSPSIRDGDAPDVAPKTDTGKKSSSTSASKDKSKDKEPEKAKPPAKSDDVDDTLEGETGSCDDECDDDDVCTRDVLTIRPDDCTCSHVPITVMRDGDACCPSGGSAEDDSDCDVGALCGNMEIDPGEACDGGRLCGSDCTPLFDSSLVHRYTFDGEGREVSDSVGDADGSLINGMLDGSGDLRLSGTNQYVQLPAGLISGLTSATIEVWLTTASGGGGQRVFDFGNQSSANEGTSYWALTSNSIADGNVMTLLNLTPQVDIVSGDQYLSGRSPIEPGMKRDVAVVFDAEARNLSLYVDGVLQGNRADIMGSLSDIDDMNAWIGRAQFGSYPYFTGRIHDFRIYDTALSAAAIAASFRAGSDPDR